MNQTNIDTGYDDLYGDLEAEIKPAVLLVDNQTTSNKPVAGTRQINVQKEREEIRVLTLEVERLKQENNILKKNMGTLYRSVKLELDRKDARIMSLEEELIQKR